MKTYRSFYIVLARTMGNSAQPEHSSKHGVAQSGRSIATAVCSNLLSVAAAASLGLLGWIALPRTVGFKVDYSAIGAIGELLLVIVIALEGRVAIWELSHSQRSSRREANAAIFAMHEKYLSPDYQAEVRRTAWFCLWKARRDSSYREKVLAGLGGGLPEYQVEEAYERKRTNGSEVAGDHELWNVYIEYHRVQDILAFFNSLSILPADPEIVDVCDFFYEFWRYPLYRIVQDLQDYRPMDQDAETEKLRKKRCDVYRTTLAKLDSLFGLGKLTQDDWDTNSLLMNQP